MITIATADKMSHDEFLKEAEILSRQPNNLELIQVEKPRQFAKFYKDGSLTLMSVKMEDANLYFNWLKQFTDFHNERMYVFTGKQMNDYYKLTDWNAYPDDLLAFAVMQEDMKCDSNVIALERFLFEGRWFDDIVAENRVHQRQINNEKKAV